MPKPETDILTVDEVASYLKVAERTVYRLAAAKKIPAFKVGGGVAFFAIRHHPLDSAPIIGRSQN